ncbi:MAG: translation initiation factor IF-2 [Dehalococcoidia bacterium]|nr:translation initiation factor IF-2 [Dehalococcoidia bacterium]
MKNEESKPVEVKSAVEAKKTPAAPAVPRVELPESLSVRELASVLSRSSIEIIKQLMRNGVMANINQLIDFETAANVATAFGFQVVEKRKLKSRVAMLASRREKELLKGEGSEKLQLRPPVVTILGHVDHGKTTLLDAIRKTNVTASEAGGITQHIGAYQVDVDGRKVTFLDTPGHEAFTAMRARGAQVTDIAVLVVAADDGVMPQTVEAIDHAKAAGVPIVVAANKMDKADAQPERIKQQLADHGLMIEEWGGDVIFVPVSAKKGTGITDLLQNLLVVAEIAELKANPDRPAVGIVVEAGMDKSKGPMATVLIKNGTLRLGDTVVVGETLGKVKALFDDKGKRLKEAGPATPVGILGLSEVPGAGDELNAVKDEQEARKLLAQKQAQKLKAKAGKAVSLDNLYARINAGQMKEVNVVLKADVQGSIQPIRDSLDKLSDEQVRVNVIHAGTGGITESDILLGLASKAIVVGFNSRPEPGAKRLAEMEGVDIRFYNIIYNLIDDMGKALKGVLEPTYEEFVEGHAEIRAVFGAGKNAKIAGALIRDGKASRGSGIRVIRQGKVVHASRISSLRRFKEDVAEVNTGFECGIGVEGFTDLQVGDMLEFFRKERTS